MDATPGVPWACTECTLRHGDDDPKERTFLSCKACRAVRATPSAMTTPSASATEALHRKKRPRSPSSDETNRAAASAGGTASSPVELDDEADDAASRRSETVMLVAEIDELRSKLSRKELEIELLRRDLDGQREPTSGCSQVVERFVDDDGRACDDDARRIRHRGSQVVEFWIKLEKRIEVLLPAARARGDGRSFRGLIRNARHAGLSTVLCDLALELTLLRNEAAHEASGTRIGATTDDHLQGLFHRISAEMDAEEQRLRPGSGR